MAVLPSTFTASVPQGKPAPSEATISTDTA